MARKTRTTLERTIVTAERDAKAAHLRAQGRGYREISAELGYTGSNAYKAVQRAIAAAPVEAVAEMRAMQGQLLDEVIAKLWDVVLADHPLVSQGRVMHGIQDAGPVIAALNGIVRAAESKRRLFGLDAPARQTITVITEDAVDAELRHLEEELASQGVTGVSNGHGRETGTNPADLALSGHNGGHGE